MTPVLSKMKTRNRPDKPFYDVWYRMWDRCENTKRHNYKNYGGRGIKVCSRWESFDNFKSDMAIGYERGLQIDRRDNNLDYSPENCRWVTRSQNMQNSSKSIFTDNDVPRLLHLRNVDKLTWLEIANIYGSPYKSTPINFLKYWRKRNGIVST
jgi:hypothetical protein